MAEVRLSSNWAGYPPGKTVSVSVVRAEYLVNDLKIAKYTKEQLAMFEAEKAEAKEKVVDKIKGTPKPKTTPKGK